MAPLTLCCHQERQWFLQLSSPIIQPCSYALLMRVISKMQIEGW